MPRTKFEKPKKIKKVNGWKIGKRFRYEGKLFQIIEFPGGNTVFGKEVGGSFNIQTSFDRIKKPKKLKVKNNNKKLKKGDFFKVKDDNIVHYKVEKISKKGIVFGTNRVMKMGYPSSCSIHISNVEKI